MKQSDVYKIINDTKNSGGRVGLAVEGGGLRGVVSATMLKLIEDLGLVHELDGVAGTSAGALNLAYFLNNDIHSGLSLYKALANKNFIQPWRWPNAMNLGYLFNQQIPHHYPVHWQALRQHKVPFYISMTDTQTGQTIFNKAQDCKSDEELERIIKASCSAPLFTTHKEFINGHYYNDGQVEQAIPIKPFLDGDYDVVFCLLTRPKGYRKTTSFINQTLQKVALYRYSKSYQMSYENSSKIYNKVLETLHVSKKPKFIPLCIEENDFIISKMTMDPQQIKYCIESTLRRFQSEERV